MKTKTAWNWQKGLISKRLSKCEMDQNEAIIGIQNGQQYLTKSMEAPNILTNYEMPKKWTKMYPKTDQNWVKTEGFLRFCPKRAKMGKKWTNIFPKETKIPTKMAQKQSKLTKRLDVKKSIKNLDHYWWTKNLTSRHFNRPKTENLSFEKVVKVMKLSLRPFV